MGIKRALSFFSSSSFFFFCIRVTCVCARFNVKLEQGYIIIANDVTSAPRARIKDRNFIYTIRLYYVSKSARVTHKGRSVLRSHFIPSWGFSSARARFWCEEIQHICVEYVIWEQYAFSLNVVAVKNNNKINNKLLYNYKLFYTAGKTFIDIYCILECV